MVHACWDDKQINWLKENYKGITSEFLTQASDKESNSSIYQIVEESLKGKETKLPNNLSFTDKDGAVRKESRIKWWIEEEKRKTYNDILMGCPTELIHRELPSDLNYHSYSGTKPVFFGHYWLTEPPEITNKKAICLDYSVAKGGLLVACRLDIVDGELEKTLVY